MKKAMVLTLMGLLALLISACKDDQDAAALEAAIASINLPERIISPMQLALPTTVEGVAIAWDSDEPDIISEAGNVHVDATTQAVTLTATFTIGGLRAVETYVILVGQSDAMRVVAALDAITLPRTLFHETSLNLPTSLEGVHISWNSSSTAHIDTDGTVRLPGQGEAFSVTLTATATLHDASDSKSFTIRLEHLTPLHFPEAVTRISHYQAPIFYGPIHGEIAPPVNPPCFAGAWYNKAVSSRDAWLGIEGVITLPELEWWDGRFDLDRNRYLDNASIYLGGNAGAETDVGLIWEVGCSNAFCTSPTQLGIAWRPFWRYIHAGQNTYAHENFRKPEFYYLPGDTLRITVFSPQPGYLQMEIQVLEVTTIDKYVARRASWRIENNRPSDFVSPMFPSIGHGGSNAEFKRVNAIDQVGNEGRPAQDTEAQVLNAVWHEMFLYRDFEGMIMKVPFTTDRYASMRCPDPRAHVVHYDGVDQTLGGEVLSIIPKRVQEEE